MKTEPINTNSGMSSKVVLQSLQVKNFTCLPDGQYDFASGINVVLGENGTGKTHLLKLIYSTLRTLYEVKTPAPKKYARCYAGKLEAVFRPDKIGNLVRHSAKRQGCEVKVCLSETEYNVAFSFVSKANSPIKIDTAPQKVLPYSPVYIPAQEIISFVPWFTALYGNYVVPFEETWVDIATMISVPPLRDWQSNGVVELIKPITDVLGGELETDMYSGCFYLRSNGKTIEMPMLSEGHRKLAMLALLIQNGTILNQGFLLWDTPEAHLNPKLLRVVAKMLVELAKRGVQIFIATHSLFLIREIYLLLNQDNYKDVPQKWLNLVKDGNTVLLEAGDHINDLSHLAVLDENVHQSGRYLSMEAASFSVILQA